MIAIVCIDDNGGMMFNNRRQSRDVILLEKIIEITKGSKLWLNMIINIIAGIIVFALCAGIIGSPILLVVWIRKKIKKKKENTL